LQYLRAQGYLCAIVEKWNAHAQVRQDLWGIADILAVRGQRVDSRDRAPHWIDIVLVQTTTIANIAAREKKIRAKPHTEFLLRAGVRIAIHGWGRNQFKEVELTL
jgi:hypothetical protein